MMTRRRLPAHHLRRFGRRARGFLADPPPGAPLGLSDDVRLFALTFAGGFLFMSVYLA